ncbi:Ancient conserved domain protein 2 [Pelomyxa schiedti]|nr:Ancient conserved domain protein 2 [Pelomyxa schiedti]
MVVSHVVEVIVEIFEWVAIIGLLCLSATFSGLNLGILALDKNTLKIVIRSGESTESKYASRIYPIRKRGNLLLCTLLIGNVAVNSLLSILLAERTTGLVGFFVSTVIITTFGEILPQSICSRHALFVGGHVFPLVYVIMFLLFPVTFPVSKALDFLLGQEVPTTYTRTELKHLIDAHTSTVLTKQDASLMSGVLELPKQTVKDIMQPADDVFMLDIESSIDSTTISELIQRGVSRVPVFVGNRDNVHSCLYVKDLTFFNPEDATPLRSVLSFYARPLPHVDESTTLDKMLSEFTSHKSRMAMVQRINNEGPGDPFYEIVGAVTIEDVIEQIIQHDIADDTDSYDVSQKPGLKEMLSKMNKGVSPKLNQNQLSALTLFVSTLEEFSNPVISKDILQLMLSQAIVEYIPAPSLEAQRDHKDYLYKRGVANSWFSVIMEGRVSIKSGKEGFSSESGPFTIMGLDALKTDLWIPDFSVRIKTSLTVVRLNKEMYEVAKEQTKTSRSSTTTLPHTVTTTTSTTTSSTTTTQLVSDISTTPTAPSLSNTNQE